MEGIPQSFQGLYIFIVLLPGFVTLLVYRSLSYQHQDSGPIVVARALAYSFVTYAAWVVLCAMLPCLPDISDIVKSPERAPWLIGGLLVIGFLLGVGLARLANGDHLMGIARKHCLTKRSSNVSLWLDVFHDYYPMRQAKKNDRKANKEQANADRKQQYPLLVVTLNDGRKVEGWPIDAAEEYSDGPVLLLNGASWLVGDPERRISIPDPGILLNGSQISLMELRPEHEQNEE